MARTKKPAKRGRFGKTPIQFPRPPARRFRRRVANMHFYTNWSINKTHRMGRMFAHPDGTPSTPRGNRGSRLRVPTSDYYIAPRTDRYRKRDPVPSISNPNRRYGPYYTL